MAKLEKTSKPEKISLPTEHDKSNHDTAIADTNPFLQPKLTAKTPAKAGKRSAKAAAEAEIKETKEQRKKQSLSKDVTTKKIAKKPTRPKLERAGKKFRQAAEQVEKGKVYSLAAATELAVKTSSVNFDATVEMHINLGVDPKQADQNVRDILTLPAGSGKTQRIAVLAEANDVEKAKKAGANVAGGEELLEQIAKEEINFDILIATPSMMAGLAKYARILGPRGLMPNPKSGTVTPEVSNAVAEAKAGRVEYRVDSTGIIHLAIGRVSFGPQKLQQNAQAILASVRAAKPSSLKGTYVKSLYITTSMGPSIPTELPT